MNRNGETERPKADDPVVKSARRIGRILDALDDHERRRVFDALHPLYLPQDHVRREA
jgi:hypothetical protein